MAYLSKENYEAKKPALMAVMKKYGVKGSVSRKDCSYLVITIKGGKLDFAAASGRECSQVMCAYPPKWAQLNTKEGACIMELCAIAQAGNHDRSDSQTDYYDVGWYADILVNHVPGQRITCYPA